MSPKKTSKAGRKAPVGADPSDGKSSDEPGDLPASEGLEKSAESYEDSLDAILLQAGSRPPETTAAKGMGSRTLMGIGIESLNLPGLSPALSPASEADETTASDSSGPTLTGEDAVDVKSAGKSAGSVDDTQVTSLLDEVAQALNVQASEHRDRARGKAPGQERQLPGMTSSDSAASPPAAASPAPAAHAPLTALTDGAEFEDPDDGPTSLTPGIISFSESPKSDDLDLVGVSPEDEAVVLGPASANKSPAAGTDSRSSGKLPPIPGLSGPVAAPVGPPPGVSRTATPPSGLQSGRVRQPTPAPGTPSLPPPPSGRLSLPPGMVSAPVLPLPTPSQLDMNAPATLDASRRVSPSLSGSRTGRVTRSGSGNVSQPVILSNPGSPLPVMPTVLAAQVKIGTLSLAGLIAVTFAGGLLVGMLVWRGQAREPVRAEHVRPAGTTTPVVTTATAPVLAPAAASPPAAVAPIAPAAAAAGAIAAAPVVAGRPAPAPAGAPTTAALSKDATATAPATPIAAAPGDEEPKAPPPRAVASRQAPRPVRRPVTTPTVADTAALFPKAASKPAAAPAASAAPAAAPKTVASNAPAKTAPKTKGKTAWHDPFAD